MTLCATSAPSFDKNYHHTTLKVSLIESDNISSRDPHQILLYYFHFLQSLHLFLLTFIELVISKIQTNGLTWTLHDQVVLMTGRQSTGLWVAVDCKSCGINQNKQCKQEDGRTALIKFRNRHCFRETVIIRTQ